MAKVTSTIIKECVCVSKFQDDTYGMRKRVHNPMKVENGSSSKVRCTVCRSEKPA